jgi:uncharacterized protein with HEPN domain
MQPRTSDYLLDVIDACADIERLTRQLSIAHYVAEKDARRLVERYLEIVGEALRRLERTDPTVALQIPGLRQWVNLRNVIAHGYDAIDDEIIWRVCRDQVPALREAIERLLAELEM